MKKQSEHLSVAAAHVVEGGHRRDQQGRRHEHQPVRGDGGGREGLGDADCRVLYRARGSGRRRSGAPAVATRGWPDPGTRRPARIGARGFTSSASDSAPDGAPREGFSCCGQSLVCGQREPNRPGMRRRRRRRGRHRRRRGSGAREVRVARHPEGGDVLRVVCRTSSSSTARRTDARSVRTRRKGATLLDIFVELRDRFLAYERGSQPTRRRHVRSAARLGSPPNAIPAFLVDLASSAASAQVLADGSFARADARGVANDHGGALPAAGDLDGMRGGAAGGELDGETDATAVRGPASLEGYRPDPCGNTR